MKTDGKSLFRTVVEDNKSDGNETTIENGVDDEDITGGSGSGDTAIEIEEDPLIFNTTQDLKISGRYLDFCFSLVLLCITCLKACANILN